MREDIGVKACECEVYLWHGFAGFTPQEFKVIERLMLKVERVNISLCTDCLDGGASGGTDVFSSVKAAYRKFVKLATEQGVKLSLLFIFRTNLYRVLVKVLNWRILRTG